MAGFGAQAPHSNHLLRRALVFVDAPLSMAAASVTTETWGSSAHVLLPTHDAPTVLQALLCPPPMTNFPHCTSKGAVMPQLKTCPCSNSGKAKWCGSAHAGILGPQAELKRVSCAWFRAAEMPA